VGQADLDLVLGGDDLEQLNGGCLGQRRCSRAACEGQYRGKGEAGPRAAQPIKVHRFLPWFDEYRSVRLDISRLPNRRIRGRGRGRWASPACHPSAAARRATAETA